MHNAVHLAGAQLRMSFIGVTVYVIGKAWQFCQLDLYTRLHSCLAWRVWSCRVCSVSMNGASKAPFHVNGPEAPS